MKDTRLLGRKHLSLGILFLFLGSSIIPTHTMTLPSSYSELVGTETQTLKTTDTTPPVIIINFAGNLSDHGGPFWRPPSESVQLTGPWANGYYTNDSQQAENWIYINLTVTDNTGVDKVWLHWLNETAWSNDSYQFIYTVGNYWEFNSSGIIPTAEGYRYSFDVFGLDTSGNAGLARWNKTVIGGVYTRRYVQLHCHPTNMTYTPLYFFNASYGSDSNKADRLHHDQGMDGSWADTGYLLRGTPTSELQQRRCAEHVGLWFDEHLCPESFTLSNIYYHVWWNSTADNIKLGWNFSRKYGQTNSDINAYINTPHDAKSNVTIGLMMHYLSAGTKLSVHPTLMTDNNIYEFNFYANHSAGGIDIIRVSSNRSYTSFIILNIPENDTLQIIDTDGDGLTDYEELWITSTNPFLIDTDNDGIFDYNESFTGSDPNDYTDPIQPFLHGDANGDGIVDVGDVIYLINYLFKSGPAPVPLISGDCNNDGVINVGDIVYLINYLFKGGPAPG